MNIAILTNQAETAYAVSELRKFLPEFTNAEITDSAPADKTVTLTVDQTMEAHHYSIRGDGNSLVIRGGNASSVLCGVCDALADAGILFEANGFCVPHTFDLDVFFAVNKTVRPKFRLRGIRQHINFTMDISSYPLKDAQEYIRNLARMRYNAITFHSYPGQWHESDPANPGDHAGHFFYGQTHPVPENDPLTASRIHNRRYYCIPEAEAIFEDEAARGEYAKYWLNEVMKTARECGMEITLSVEILSGDDDVNIRMMNTLCKTYPLIDTIELISEECGGFRDEPGVTQDNILPFMTETLGDDILDADGKLPGMPDFLPHQLPSAAVCVKKMLRVLDIRDKWLCCLEKIPALRAGLYLTCADTLRVLRPILRNRLPEGMTMSLLSAHGALAVADNIERTGTVSSDWQNTMFYSWAEFDGNMFVQQMSTDGIEKLSKMPDTDSSYGYCINHWRTAENSLAISYAAEASVTAMPAHAFYLSHAKKIGITDGDGFADACTRLASLDTYNRDNLFNIGFCAIVCWLNWHRRGDIMMPRQFPAEFLSHAVSEYEGLIAMWKKLLPAAECKEGIAFLRLMINRCECSILHIRALQTLDELTAVYDYDNPIPPTAEQVKKASEIIARARGYAQAYMHRYGSYLPDRGGEGQLVSYAVTTPVFIDAVAATFERVTAVVQNDIYDAPPMPDAEVR